MSIVPSFRKYFTSSYISRAYSGKENLSCVICLQCFYHHLNLTTIGTSCSKTLFTRYLVQHWLLKGFFTLSNHNRVRCWPTIGYYFYYDPQIFVNSIRSFQQEDNSSYSIDISRYFKSAELL